MDNLEPENIIETPKSSSKTIKILKALGIVGAASFAGLGLVALSKVKDSRYSNEPSEKNPFEGKRVVFVEDADAPKNADGVNGYLEAGETIHYKNSLYDKYFKRAADIFISGTGLIVLAPVFAGIAIAIKVDDPGNVLFCQKRVGKNKQFFKLHKFRSMKTDMPKDIPTHMVKNPEQYITRVGKFLRAHSLDELPQIWDIFIGNMSIVGPRPGLWNQDLLTSERDKYNANNVRPGLTGWAQINGRDELEIPVKAKYDGEYIKNESLAFDAKCFIGTLTKVASDDAVVEGGTGALHGSSKFFKPDYAENANNDDLIGNIGFGSQVNVDKSAKRKVLITGAGSYIGESFKSYAAKNYPENFQIETIDMLDANWRNKDFSKYDIVYHVAGLAHADVGNVSDEVKQKYYAVNTDLAVEVCKKAKQDGVKQFIFMSSMIVYGDSAPFGHEKIIDAKTVPQAANFYGDSKLQADVAVRKLATDNFHVVVLRPPMIYGKNSKGNFPTLIKIADKLPVFPKISNQRSMLYIDNLCEFLCQIMLVEVKQNSTVLIPQNREFSNTSELVRQIGKSLGKKVVLAGGPAELSLNVFARTNKKVSDIINKAFGSNCYAQDVSRYPGIDYQKISLLDSISATCK